MDTPGSSSVQSVERAFALLEAMSRRDRGSGVTELADDSGLSPSTIHRLLQTLVSGGYVRREPGRLYALGSGLIRLGEQATLGVATWCLPLLTQLVGQLGESVNLAGLSGDEVVYLAHVPSAQSIRMFTEVGSRVPAHSTGVGKAMLAQLDHDDLSALLERTGMPAVTPHTHTGPDALEAELTVIADRGFAMDEQENELGVRCVAVAAPSSRSEGSRLGVSMSGPASRVTDALVDRAVPLLTRVATTISEEVSRDGW